MLMIDRAQVQVGTLPKSRNRDCRGYTQRYNRMLDVPVTSLDAFVSEAQTTRYQIE